MKKTLLKIACMLLLSGSFYAQQGDGGFPVTSMEEVKSTTFDKHVFATPNISDLKAEDEITDADKSGPWRFGFNNYTNLSLDNSGTWYTLPNGGKIWRIELECKEALTVNLTFENTLIPDGNELYVYNPDKSFILGKFTQNHVYEGQLGTELVPGSIAIVEYYVSPENINAAKSLTIGTVTHGYRTADEFQIKAFGSSGSCNMNVACPEGLPWENQIRATVMLVSGSNGFCTGSMINNTQNDGKPYVLTANHCYSSPTNWIFRFNWQSSTCSNPGSSPSFVSLSGAVLRARRTPSDFCLVEITGGLSNGTVPASYNTYFPGWDNNDTPPTSSVCVHHPSGDIKKLAFDNNPSVSANGMGSSEANSQWRMQWDLNTTTEPGSSGSPLFNQVGRIIGQLWGGGASCSNQTAYDYYGKVSYSWEPAGSNSTNQLKYWLDPNNDGLTVLDGFDPIVICSSTYSYSTTEELCYGDDSGTATVVFTSGNSSGATFDIGSGPQPTGVFSNLAQGSYTVIVTDGDTCATSVNITISGPSVMNTSASTSFETAPFNGSINLTVSGGIAPYTYAWTGPNGFTATTEDISGLEGGAYSCLITDANGCTLTGNYTVNSVVGLMDLEALSFQLYPNPSNGIFNFTMNNADNVTFEISVTDLSGRIVYADKMNGEAYMFDLNDKADGSYILHVSNNQTHATKRIVLKK